MSQDMIPVTENVMSENKLAEQQGKKLYRTNQPLRDLATVMEHPEMKQFFEKYFSDWEVTKAMLLLMKTYQVIDNKMPSDTNPFQKIAILSDLLDHSDTRQHLVEAFAKFTSDHNHPDHVLHIEHDKKKNGLSRV